MTRPYLRSRRFAGRGAVLVAAAGVCLSVGLSPHLASSAEDSMPTQTQVPATGRPPVPNIAASAPLAKPVGVATPPLADAGTPSPASAATGVVDVILTGLSPIAGSVLAPGSVPPSLPLVAPTVATVPEQSVTTAPGGGATSPPTSEEDSLGAAAVPGPTANTRAAPGAPSAAVPEPRASVPGPKASGPTTTVAPLAAQASPAEGASTTAGTQPAGSGAEALLNPADPAEPSTPAAPAPFERSAAAIPAALSYANHAQSSGFTDNASAPARTAMALAVGAENARAPRVTGIETVPLRRGGRGGATITISFPWDTSQRIGLQLQPSRLLNAWVLWLTASLLIMAFWAPGPTHRRVPTTVRPGETAPERAARRSYSRAA